MIRRAVEWWRWWWRRPDLAIIDAHPTAECKAKAVGYLHADASRTRRWEYEVEIDEVIWGAGSTAREAWIDAEMRLRRASWL